jgi:hypothetical protein
METPVPNLNAPYPLTTTFTDDTRFNIVQTITVTKTVARASCGRLSLLKGVSALFFLLLVDVGTDFECIVPYAVYAGLCRVVDAVYVNGGCGMVAEIGGVM